MLCALPAVAAAATFEVDTTADGDSLPGLCEPGHECTLRKAIEKADSSPGADTISFAALPAGSVFEIEEAELPGNHRADGNPR